jgi:hypothetical protein
VPLDRGRKIITGEKYSYKLKKNIVRKRIYGEKKIA